MPTLTVRAVTHHHTHFPFSHLRVVPSLSASSPPSSASASSVFSPSLLDHLHGLAGVDVEASLLGLAVAAVLVAREVELRPLGGRGPRAPEKGRKKERVTDEDDKEGRTRWRTKKMYKKEGWGRRER